MTITVFFFKIFLLFISEQCMQEDFEKLDKESTGFLSVTEIKHAILKCLDKKFQDLLGQSNVGKEIGGEVEDSKTGSVNHPTSNETVIGSMPSPPDGGWGWVIVFACFMCNLIISKFKGMYNRLPLTKCLILDINQSNIAFSL